MMATIEKRKTKRGETTYQVRWWNNGQRIERWVRTHEEAKALKLQAEGDALAGVTFDPRPGKQVLNAYFGSKLTNGAEHDDPDGWLATRLVKGRPLRPTTKNGYRGVWRRMIEKQLGTKPMNAITIEMVRKWHSAAVKASSADQAAKAYRVLRAVMATAESDGLLRLNPCRIRGAGQEHHDERPMTPTAVVCELAEAVDPRYRALVLLAGFGSLRTGESLGLRRRDVDVLHRTVRVASQLQEIEGHSLHVEHAKSDAGNRTVALPRVVVDALDEHLATFTPADPDAFVFVAPQGGVVKRARLSTAWQAAKLTVGAPAELRLHDLRHHAATLSARMPGITTKELMSRIGHASPRAALIYQHATEERDRAIASFLDDEIAAARG